MSKNQTDCHTSICHLKLFILPFRLSLNVYRVSTTLPNPWPKHFLWFICIKHRHTHSTPGGKPVPSLKSQVCNSSLRVFIFSNNVNFILSFILIFFHSSLSLCRWVMNTRPYPSCAVSALLQCKSRIDSPSNCWLLKRKLWCVGIYDKAENKSDGAGKLKKI